MQIKDDIGNTCTWLVAVTWTIHFRSTLIVLQSLGGFHMILGATWQVMKTTLTNMTSVYANGRTLRMYIHAVRNWQLELVGWIQQSAIDNAPERFECGTSKDCGAPWAASSSFCTNSCIACVITVDRSSGGLLLTLDPFLLFAEPSLGFESYRKALQVKWK